MGQKEVIHSLTKLLGSQKIGHAYVFSGPKGIGKRSVAKIFSALLLCDKSVSGETCGGCMPCSLFEAGTHPDFYMVDTQNATISVEDIRKLQEDIIVRPMYSERKVYLIADADKMTIPAQNCLLKTLEEPQGYAVLILTVSSSEMLLETIRSRTVRYSFKKSSSQEMKQFLESRYGSNVRGLDFIASYSEGVIGTALELANADEFLQVREKTLEILLKLRNSKLLDVFEAYDFFEANKSDIDKVLDIMLLFYRDLLTAKKAWKENILINSDKKDIILDNAGRFTTARLIHNTEVIEETRKNIKQNANYQLSIEVMLMKLQEDTV